MSRLTEEMVVARTRQSDLSSIKKLNCWGAGLSDVSVLRSMPSVEVLAFSLNHIKSLEDFAWCPSLRELYVRKNEVQDLSEILHLTQLPHLKNLWLEENPCTQHRNYRLTVLRHLPQLETLDNVAVEARELQLAQTHGDPFVGGAAPDAAPDAAPQPHPDQEEDETHYAEEATQREQYERQRQTEQYERQRQTEQQEQYERPRQTEQQEQYERQRQHDPQEQYERQRQHDPQEQYEQQRQHDPQEQYEQQRQEYYESPPTSPTPIQEEEEAYESSARGGPSHSLSHSPVAPSLSHAHAHNGHHHSPDHSHHYYAERESITPQMKHSQSAHTVKGGGGWGRERDEASPPCRHSADMSHYSADRCASERDRDRERERDRECVASALMAEHRGFKRRPATRTSNLLSAVLCLVRELDYASLEVAEMAVRCRMDELASQQ